MIKKINDELNNYLGFDSNELFNSSDFIVIFGGALRDIIANDSDSIKDIDIMCLPKSKKSASILLESKGYKLLGLFSPDLFCLYKDIKCIFEPKTFVKDGKIVQLITPSTYNLNNFNKTKKEISLMLQENFFRILKNVDLSSSGIVYDGKCLYESVKGSIDLIKSKKYYTLKHSLMYNNDRIIFRKHNLLNKQWTEINLKDNLVYERLLKISSIRSNFPFIDELEKSIINDGSLYF